MQKREQLYKGKAKSVYKTDDPDHYVMLYRNDTSAFDGQKVAQLERKGLINNHVNAFIMQTLQQQGVPTHFVKLLNAQESLVKRLDMIPVECVVRNVAAGSLVRRLGVKEGMELNPPTFEFFFKNDQLHDPMINESHILSFNWASAAEIEQMKALSFKTNTILKALFAKAGIVLVDYKLEFGRYQGQVVLGDEFSPDGCRLWDAKTRKKLDKDRFRQDLGNVVEGYAEVAQRLGVTIPPV